MGASVEKVAEVSVAGAEGRAVVLAMQKAVAKATVEVATAAMATMAPVVVKKATLRGGSTARRDPCLEG